MNIVILGASGRSGADLCRRFHHAGYSVVAIARDADKISRLNLPAQVIIQDLNQITSAGWGADDIIINAAHARYTANITKFLSPTNRLIVLGSMRIKSRVREPNSQLVRDALVNLEQSCPCPWIMLCPTMIYGAAGERNIQVLLSFIRRIPIFPLPRAADNWVQPIHQRDVAQCVLNSVKLDFFPQKSVPIAGGQKLRYSEMLSVLAEFLHRKLWILPTPNFSLSIFKILLKLAGRDAKIIDRLLEDKSISDAEYKYFTENLHINPLSLSQGLRIQQNLK